MFNIDKSIKGIIGTPRKRGGRKDWDGDGVPNWSDCQPRNVMRQDKIKKPYDVTHKGLWIGYGNRVIKQKESAIMINDVKKVFINNPSLMKKSKGLSAVEIESYNPRNSIARFSVRSGFDKDGNFVKDVYPPMIRLQANPTREEIKKYGKENIEQQYKKRIKGELQHELQHYKQHKEGRFFVVKKGKVIRVNKKLQEAEALKAMTPTHYYAISEHKRGHFTISRHRTKQSAEKLVEEIKYKYGDFATVLTPTQYEYLDLRKKVTVNRIRAAQKYA